MATSNYIPANETFLSLDGWTNGSLFNQTGPNWVYSSYPSDYQDQQLNLTVLPNNLASLTFNVTQGTPLTFPLAQVMFDPNTLLIPIFCAYPLSGQYDTLSRILFYVLMVVALLFRRHTWISVTALGAAMTYAAVSAVHLFALIANFTAKAYGFTSFGVYSSQQYADLDVWGIFPIIAVSGIMLTPILMWSNTVRLYNPTEDQSARKRRYKAQPIIIYWGILIFTALMALIIYVFALPGGPWSDDLLSFASCSITPFCVSNQPTDSNMSRDYYDTCDCIDFCGTLSPTAPMRTGANMVAYLPNITLQLANRRRFHSLGLVGIAALVFIVLYGIVGLVGSKYSQAEVRNTIFAVLNGDRGFWIKRLFDGQLEKDMLEHWDKNHPITKKWNSRYAFAKAIATSFFVTALVLTVLAPAIFIIAIVVLELWLQSLPVSEYSDAVGAWGTWVAAAFILMAAIIDQFHDSWVEYVLVFLGAAYLNLTDKTVDQSVFLPSADPKRTVGEMAKDFFLVLASPFVHGWHSTRGSLWTAKRTLKMFSIWWRKPVQMSRLNRDESERELEGELEKNAPNLIQRPKCICRLCVVDAKRSGYYGDELQLVTKKVKEDFKEYIKKSLGPDFAKDSSQQSLISEPGGIQASSIQSGPDKQSPSPSEIPLQTRGTQASSIQSGPDNQPPPPSEVPLSPTPRSTFQRQDTDRSILQSPMPVASILPQQETLPQLSGTNALP